MTNYSRFFLLLSLFIILFNGSSLGYIIYQFRLGETFGIILFHITCLFGALCASIANEKNDTPTFYEKFFYYTNLVVFFLPYYYLFISEVVLSNL
ncbi:hypothetical protein ACFFIX_03800 [Metabacillus herbersteinensis]|uniref:Uncharacterized protein n=1 Tax=Metabacillus herbersteinensis TaxID=283816 RepID=A0ABV6GA66_9BACI